MNALSIAWDSIWTHRLRSGLTALGVVIGVFAVVTLTSLGAGVRSYVRGQFRTFGATTITVSSALPSASGKGAATGHSGFGGHQGGLSVPDTLTLGDWQALAGFHGQGLSRVAPVVTLPLPVARQAHASSGAPVIGTSAAYFPIEALTYARGAFTGHGAVLGSAAARLLFPKVSNPVGRTLYVGTWKTSVTGVLKPGQGLLGRSANPDVFVPAGQGLKVAGLGKISEIIVQATGNSHVSQAAGAITHVLSRRHPLRDFSVVKDSQMLTTISNTLSTITTFLSGLAAISLLVGGIGIMNIMLVTVTERFKEIGIRKALGARDSDVLVQFLAESVLLAVLGGGVGVLLSAVASNLIGRLAGFPAGLTWSSIMLALVFSVGVGVLFGVLPALRASRLMPAEALRTE